MTAHINLAVRVLLVALWLVPSHAGAQELVIVDSDMNQLGDDAVAMFMMVNSPDVEVLGVTIVSGNGWVEEGTAYALRQLELIGRQDIPVLMGGGVPLMGNRRARLEAEERLWGKVNYMGAYSRPRPPSYRQLGREPVFGYPTIEPSDENAVDFIVRTVKAHPNEVTLLVIGPATNIALAIRKNPEIIPLVKRVVYMGGAVDVPANTTPSAEFNWWFDPEAARISVRAPFREQWVIPHDVALRVLYTKAEYDRITSAPETPIVRMFQQRHGPRFEADPDRESFVWDAIAAAIILRPSIGTDVEERFLDVDTHYGPTYGRSLAYHEGRRRSLAAAADFPDGTQKVTIVFDIDRDAFWHMYVELMTAPTRGMQ